MSRTTAKLPTAVRNSGLRKFLRRGNKNGKDRNISDVSVEEEIKTGNTSFGLFQSKKGSNTSGTGAESKESFTVSVAEKESRGKTPMKRRHRKIIPKKIRTSLHNTFSLIPKKKTAESDVKLSESIDESITMAFTQPSISTSEDDEELSASTSTTFARLSVEKEVFKDLSSTMNTMNLLPVETSVSEHSISTIYSMDLLEVENPMLETIVDTNQGISPVSALPLVNVLNDDSDNGSQSSTSSMNNSSNNSEHVQAQEIPTLIKVSIEEENFKCNTLLTNDLIRPVAGFDSNASNNSEHVQAQEIPTLIKASIEEENFKCNTLLTKDLIRPLAGFDSNAEECSNMKQTWFQNILSCCINGDEVHKKGAIG